MPKNVKYPGICSICDNALTCNYLQSSKQPVIQCEEFDGTSTRPVKLAREDILEAINSRNKSGDEKGDSGKYKGLCINCDNRKTCSCPKPEGGTWHCEEYL